MDSSKQKTIEDQYKEAARKVALMEGGQQATPRQADQPPVRPSTMDKADAMVEKAVERLRESLIHAEFPKGWFRDTMCKTGATWRNTNGYKVDSHIVMIDGDPWHTAVVSHKNGGKKAQDWAFIEHVKRQWFGDGAAVFVIVPARKRDGKPLNTSVYIACSLAFLPMPITQLFPELA